MFNTKLTRLLPIVAGIFLGTLLFVHPSHAHLRSLMREEILAPAPIDIDPVIQKALIEAGIPASRVALEAAYKSILLALAHTVRWAGASAETAEGKTVQSMLARGLRGALESSTELRNMFVERIGQLANFTTRSRTITKVLADPSSYKPLMRARVGATTWGPLLIVTAAIVGFIAGYEVKKTSLKVESNYQRLLEDQADSNAYTDLLMMLARGLSSGKVHLLPGIDAATASRKIKENMETGRAPFINVIELKPCPQIAGTWSGDIFVKTVTGTSPIQEGSSRKLTFVIEEDNCHLVLKFNSNQIEGDWERGGETIPSQINGRTERMEVDNAVLRDNAVGALSRASLKTYGLGAGSLSGVVEIEIEQRTPSGATIVSGGRIAKQK